MRSERFIFEAQKWVVYLYVNHSFGCRCPMSQASWSSIVVCFGSIMLFNVGKCTYPYHRGLTKLEKICLTVWCFAGRRYPLNHNQLKICIPLRYNQKHIHTQTPKKRQTEINVPDSSGKGSNTFRGSPTRSVTKPGSRRFHKCLQQN